MPAPIYEFTSLTAGKNATVAIYGDRIEEKSSVLKSGTPLKQQ